MLTQTDLDKILSFYNLLKNEILDVKKDVKEVKSNLTLVGDSVIGIQNSLNTEHELRYERLEKVSGIVKNHKERLINLELKHN